MLDLTNCENRLYPRSVALQTTDYSHYLEYKAKLANKVKLFSFYKVCRNKYSNDPMISIPYIILI